MSLRTEAELLEWKTFPKGLGKATKKEQEEYAEYYLGV